MPKRRSRKRGSGVPHLIWRNNVAYWSRRHEKLPGGRIVSSLEVKREKEDVAITYAQALNTLCDRGDWTLVERWHNGNIHISDIARAVREGDYSPLKRLSIAGTLLGEAVDSYMRTVRATLEAGTVRMYESALKQLVDELKPDYSMAQLTTDAANAFLHAPKLYGSVQQKTIIWSAHTQNNMRTVYKALWKYVIEKEQEEAEKQNALPSVIRNPWMKAKVQKRRKTRHAFLSPEQWRTVITHPKVARTPLDAFLCAGIMGLRRDETAHLRPNIDVDVDNAVIHIQPRKGAFEWKPKTDNSVRDVPIPDELIEHFRYHAEHYAGEKFFFVGERFDQPLGKTTARNWVMKAFNAAGLKYGREGDALTQHSLRHTAATWMLSKGVPLPTVAEWLGDTQQEILATYGHAIPKDRQRAIVAMNENLSLAA